MTWNSLPNNLRDPTFNDDKFRAALKTHFFTKYQNMYHIRGFCILALHNCVITYLIWCTY